MKTALYPSTDIAINANPIGFLNKIQERLLSSKKIPKVMLGKYAKKESIGRISVPVNPTTPKQFYKPARMSSQQKKLEGAASRKKLKKAASRRN